MNTRALSARDLLLKSLRDHDTAAKNNMKIATEHLKRGYEIARELEPAGIRAVLLDEASCGSYIFTGES